ncbi:hypothetical protein [Anaerosinus sp.]
MAKKKTCYVCGKKLRGIDGTYMTNEFHKPVFVCKDDRNCQKRFIRI